MMHNTVEVVPYNPLWPKMFEEEANLIKKALGPNCIEIYHIGSTAIPRLNAKPIIDLIPVVLDITAVDSVNKKMEELGYEAKGEYGMPFRRYFQKSKSIRTHNVHIFKKNNPEIERHLLFRDWMRTHAEDRDAYAKLKIALALKFPKDINSYVFGKDEFVGSIDTKTGFNKLRFVKALTDREWQAAKTLRQKNFFDKTNILDPYTHTFHLDGHVHFVLYKGATIVGYAHIQLWNDMRAALRIIVIDEIHRNQGIGGQFLILIEKWLKSQGRSALHIAASPEAYNFYLQHEYNKMSFKDPEGHKTHPLDTEMGKIL